MDKNSTTPPAPAGILVHFEYHHLPKELLEVSKPFHDLAHAIASNIAPGPERSAGLRKLLEAKDCAVRAKRVPGA